MRHAAWTLALVAIATAARPSAGDDVDQELGLYLPVTATFVLDAGPIKLVPYLELQPRFDDDVKDLQEVQHRAALLLRPIEHLSLGPGVLWVAQLEEGYEPEYRVYEEARWDGGPLGAALRLRLEQRFFEGADDVSLRARLRVSLEPTLFELVDMPVALVLANEVFFNLNDADERKAGFEQDRAFVGLSLKLASGIKLTAGYQARLDYHRGEEPETLLHTIVVQLDFTFE